MTPRDPEAARFPLFDVMRLILALEVFLILHEPTKTFLIEGHVWTPFPPVPCFLAISGFLVLRSLERVGNYRDFIKRRALRIVPALIASLLLYVILFGPSTIVANLIVYGTAGFVVPQKGFRNGALWSLTVEEAEYVLMAVMFALGAYKQKWPIWIWLAAMIALRAAVSGNPDLYGRYMPVLIAFPAGSLVYIYRDKVARVNPWIITALLVAAVVHPWWGYHFRELANSLIAITPALVVAFCAFGPSFPIPKFPDLSYSIYIYHLPVIQWFGLRVPDAGTPVHFAVVIVLSIVSWYAIEAPALRLKEKPRIATTRSPGPDVLEEAPS